MDRLIKLKHDCHKLKPHNLPVSLRKEKETVHSTMCDLEVITAFETDI